MVEQRPAILVVDSNVDAQAQLKDLLGRANYEVIGATSFEEAKILLATKPPELLITDVRLQAFNGLQLVIHARCHFIPAIVVTSVHDAVLEAEAMRQSAAYFVKPLRPDDFLTTVSRLLAEPLPPPI